MKVLRRCPRPEAVHLGLFKGELADQPTEHVLTDAIEHDQRHSDSCPRRARRRHGQGSRVRGRVRQPSADADLARKLVPAHGGQRPASSGSSAAAGSGLGTQWWVVEPAFTTCTGLPPADPLGDTPRHPRSLLVSRTRTLLQRLVWHSSRARSRAAGGPRGGRYVLRGAPVEVHWVFPLNHMDYTINPLIMWRHASGGARGRRSEKKDSLCHFPTSADPV